jgi:hypothetical protein
MNGSEAYQSSALPQFLLCSSLPFSLPRLQAAVKAAAIAADDDLDDGMAVVLGKLPLGALRRGIGVGN